MATIRPGRCYSKINKKPWTRVSKRKPRRSYVKGVPVSKIHQFEMGKVHGKYEVAYHLVAKEPRQLRSNSMEACRVSATKCLTKAFGENGFFLKIRPYPHHVLRENAMATGAGADRFSDGMRRSFGKPIGQAARVYPGQKILTVKVPKGKEKDARLAMKRGAAKISGKYTVEREELN
jgi:large subunit ribosomal protein L10e